MRTACTAPATAVWASTVMISADRWFYRRFRYTVASWRAHRGNATTSACPPNIDLFGVSITRRVYDHAAATVARPSWAPHGMAIDKPSVAHVYDYYLGGSHNFAATLIDPGVASRSPTWRPDNPTISVRKWPGCPAPPASRGSTACDDRRSPPSRSPRPSHARLVEDRSRAVSGTGLHPAQRGSNAYLGNLAARLTEAMKAEHGRGGDPRHRRIDGGSRSPRTRSLASTITVLGSEFSGRSRTRRARTVAAGGGRARVRLRRRVAATDAQQAAARHRRGAGRAQGCRRRAMVSERRFAAVFADAAIGIGISTIDGKIIVNRAMCNIFSYTRRKFGFKS